MFVVVRLKSGLGQVNSVTLKVPLKFHLAFKVTT
jgi:hypothetical protein